MAPPFEHVNDSDPDSISITSTKPSDEETEYAVEKIQAEEPDEEGVMKYLVKWEGYPLHLSTWEPAANLLSEQILPEWEREKEDVRAGRKQAFDLDEFYEAQEYQMEENAQRQQRRAAKRRRLGMASRSGSISNGSTNNVAMRDAGDDSDESDDDEPLRERQKRVKTVIPKRKGLAQKVNKTQKRKATASSSGKESSEESEGATSEYSLSEETRGNAKAKRPNPKAAARDAPPTQRKPSNAAAAMVTAGSKSTAKQTSAPSDKAPKKAASSAVHATTAGLPSRTLPSSSARKSAPSTASLNSGNALASRRLPILPTSPAPKKKINSIVSAFMNSGAPKPGPKQRRMSESNPKQMRFSSLSEQNRVHKHAAEEAPPDPSMLGTFNFATGRFDQPAVAAKTTAPAQTRKVSLQSPAPPRPAVAPMQVAPKPTTSMDSSRVAQASPRDNAGTRPAPRAMTNPSVGAISGVYGRREAPAPTRRRSVSPPSTEDRTIPAAGNDSRRFPQKVCKYWRRKDGGCEKGGSCTFAHHHVTCPFWRKHGHCNHGDQCNWFHHEEEDREPFVPEPPESAGPPSVNNAKQIFQGFEEAKQRWRPRGGPRVHAHQTVPSGTTTIYFKDTTCKPWHFSVCHKKESDCPSAHGQTDYHFDFKEDVMCCFWITGKCALPDEKCKFAHRRTDYLAGFPGSGAVTFMPQVDEGPNAAWRQPTNDSGVQQPPIVLSPREIRNDDHTILDDGPGQDVIASPMDMTAGSRRQSLAAHRVPDQSSSTKDVVLDVKCGSHKFEVAATLGCSTEEDSSFLAESLGSQSHLQLHRMVCSADLKHYFAETLQQGARYPIGNVWYASFVDSQMAKMVETYKLHLSAGIVQDPRFTLVMYPAGTEEWNFFSGTSDVPSSQAILKFKLLPPLPHEAQQTSKVAAAAIAGTSDRAAITVAKHVLDMDMERLLKISDTKVEEQVFVMMPPSRLAEMKLVVNIFEERFKKSDYHGRKTKIWTSEKPGQWDACVENVHGACLVLIHPEVPLWDVPHLGKVLHQTSFRVFSVGVNPALAALERRQSEFGCQRLFPMGDVAFVTDDVFIHTPEKVLRIIDEVNKTNKNKPQGATRNKIVTRPGVRLWLVDFVKQTGERGREHPRWQKLLEAIWDLCPADKEDEYYPGNPSDKADLISIPPEQLPTFGDLLQTDRVRATDYIVNWFAGWACLNAGNFRRFTVCHEEPGTGKMVCDESTSYMPIMKGALADPRDWGKEFRYLLVKTPDQWLKEAKAKATVSRR